MKVLLTFTKESSAHIELLEQGFVIICENHFLFVSMLIYIFPLHLNIGLSFTKCGCGSLVVKVFGSLVGSSNPRSTKCPTLGH